jgi:hypothetical protein
MNKNARPSLVLFVLLSFLAGTLVFSGCNQSQESQTPIEGLFGIKLGEPLPPECAIEYDLGMIDGQINYTVIPPQRNAAFNEYWVTINPTNRLVCEIRGDSREASFFDVLMALRQKYGNESSKAKKEGFQAYTWWHGDRSLRLDSIKPFSSFHLSCTDNTLNHPVKPSADTNGF